MGCTQGKEIDDPESKQAPVRVVLEGEESKSHVSEGITISTQLRKRKNSVYEAARRNSIDYQKKHVLHGEGGEEEKHEEAQQDPKEVIENLKHLHGE